MARKPSQITSAKPASRWREEVIQLLHVQQTRENSHNPEKATQAHAEEQSLFSTVQISIKDCIQQQKKRGGGRRRMRAFQTRRREKLCLVTAILSRIRIINYFTLSAPPLQMRTALSNFDNSFNPFMRKS